METLYALAGMFPNIEHAGNNKLDTSPSALPEAVDRHPPKLEGKSLLISPTISIQLFI